MKMNLPENLNELNVVELREELGKRGLIKSGRKSDLVKRLSEAVTSPKVSMDQNKDVVKVEQSSHNVEIEGDNVNSNNFGEIIDQKPIIPAFKVFESLEEKSKPQGVSVDNNVLSNVKENDEVACSQVQHEFVKESIPELVEEEGKPQEQEVEAEPEEVEEPKKSKDDEDELDFDDDDIDFNQTAPGEQEIEADESKKNEIVVEPVVKVEEPKKRELEEGELPSNDTVPAKVKRQDKPVQKGLRLTVAVGHISEQPERLSDAREPINPVSSVIQVRNLVRPFTPAIFRAMMHAILSEREAPISDIWLNRIKSRAFVLCDGPESATELQKALDGCRWPSANPQSLKVDFSSIEEMTWAQEKGDEPFHEIVLPTRTPRNNIRIQISNEEVPTMEEAPQSIDKEAEDKQRESEVKTLDELFHKTAAMPNLYWMPVSKAVVQKRLEQRMEATAK